MSHQNINSELRTVLEDIAAREARETPFMLSGRGHEARVSLDRQLAGILRACELPRVHIAGWGANYFYPKRLFLSAQPVLKERLGWEPFGFSRDGSVYLTDQPATSNGANAGHNTRWRRAM